MLETSKMSEVVFCGTIGILADGGEVSTEVITQSIALAHLLCLCAEEYGLDSDLPPDGYKTKLADLGPDCMEILINYDKCYDKTIPNTSTGMKSLFGKFKDIKKSKLKDKIVNLTDDQSPGCHDCRSWGNTAVARNYSIGYAARSLDETRFMTEEVTKITHNHPEVIKACKAVNDAIFLARCGLDLDAVKNWISCEYKVAGEPACSAYDMDKSYDDIKESLKNKDNLFTFQAKNTVSAALVSVFSADSFDKALENAKSIGGDTPIICSIACAVAAAFWPIPDKRIQSAAKYLDGKKANGKISIHVGKNYGKNITVDIDHRRISEQFGQCYGKFQLCTAPLWWQLQNIKSMIEISKTDLISADEEKKKDIFKLLDSVAKNVHSRTQTMFSNDENWKPKNVVLGEIKTLLEQHFQDENKQKKELVDMLNFAIGNDTNCDGMAAPIVNVPVVNVPLIKTNLTEKKNIQSQKKIKKITGMAGGGKKNNTVAASPSVNVSVTKTNLTEQKNIQGPKKITEITEITEIADDDKKDNTVSALEEKDDSKGNDLEIATVTDLSTEMSDNQRLWSKVCGFGKFGTVILTSIATIIFAINGLWLPLGGGVFFGIILFGICQFVQNKIHDKEADLNNLSKDMSKPESKVAIKNIKETIPATVNQIKEQKIQE